jgi:hypothetical protein
MSRKWATPSGKSGCGTGVFTLGALVGAAVGDGAVVGGGKVAGKAVADEPPEAAAVEVGAAGEANWDAGPQAPSANSRTKTSKRVRLMVNLLSW